jgi:hypothetical protein
VHKTVLFIVTRYCRVFGWQHLVVGFTIGCSSSAADQQVQAAPDARRDPPWVRGAVEESARTLEVRCLELAPLERVFADDVEVASCLWQAGRAVRSARQEVYDAALDRCVANAEQSRFAGCCFARVTDRRALEEARRQQCDAECAERIGKPDTKFTAEQRCEPQVVSPVRPAGSRAHTRAVADVLRGCTGEHDVVLACSRLPTKVEREYCSFACERQNQAFRGALLLCIRHARENASVTCALDDPRAKQECEQRCRDELERPR